MKRLLVPLRGILAHPLGRRRPLYAVLRFLRWQLASRLSGPSVVPFVNSARLRVRCGMTGLTGNIYCGLHDFECMGFLLHLLRSDDLFIDVGANAGGYSVLAAKAVGSRVLAIEPSADALEALHANIALNGVAAQVEVHEVIAAECPGRMDFTVGLDTVNHVVVDAGDGHSAQSVPAQTLDALRGDRPAALIKLDVEGFELRVLRGAAQTLASSDLLSIIVEINGTDARYGLRPGDLVDVLHRAGFSCHQYDPVTRKLTAMDAASTNGNAIFVRDLPRIEARLCAAPAFSVPAWGSF